MRVLASAVGIAVASFALLAVLGILLAIFDVNVDDGDEPPISPSPSTSSGSPVRPVLPDVPRPTATVTETRTETVSAPETSSRAPEPSSTNAPGDVYYENCDEARAAGAAPVYVGEPGYGPHLDANHDGVGCER